MTPYTYTLYVLKVIVVLFFAQFSIRGIKT